MQTAKCKLLSHHLSCFLSHRGNAQDAVKSSIHIWPNLKVTQTNTTSISMVSNTAIRDVCPQRGTNVCAVDKLLFFFFFNNLTANISKINELCAFYVLLMFLQSWLTHAKTARHFKGHNYTV